MEGDERIGAAPALTGSGEEVRMRSGLGDAREQLLRGVAAAVVNVALAFLLIPRFDASGAASANLGGELSATLVELGRGLRLVARPAPLG